MSKLTINGLINKLPDAFIPENAVGLDTVIQYNLSGDEGGEWIITIKDGECTVVSGTAPQPKLTFSAKAKDFMDILSGKTDGMAAFMKGKIKLKGDMSLAMKLTTLFKVDK